MWVEQPRVWRQWIGRTIVSAAILCSGEPVIAQAAGEGAGHYTDIVTPNGRADWTTGIVTAKGIGIPPKNPASALQAKEMARTAAWAVALRNLLEAIKGVRIDSTTTVNNFVTTNDEVRTRVEGMVKGAKLVKEQEMPDGSFETTVEMKLTGDFSGVVLPKPSLRADPLPQYNKPTAVSTSYSGLVVDARGTGAHPALAPRILNEQGEEAYSVAFVEQRGVAEQGIAIYVPDLPSAQENPRVTSTPLLVKALRAAGNNRTDLVVSDADVQTIHGVPEHFKFLKQAKVLVILDAK
ncbi:MAG: LPP20 family lipoprotein [Nitrospirota bacterium]